MTTQRPGYCKEGHEIVGKNVLVIRGIRVCRFCRQVWDRNRKRRAKIDSILAGEKEGNDATATL